LFRHTGKSPIIILHDIQSSFPQIASTLGATVIATSSSASKLDFAKSLGATHVVNYAQNPNWEQEVLNLTNGKGVDHEIETGGAGTLMKSVAATRMGGLVSLLGILTANQPIPAEFTPTVLFGAKIGTLINVLSYPT
jgi:NADPH:quinone reductase-like Zn-dependent oxidoreductase